MKKQIVAANWKMNNTFDEAEELLHNLLEELQEKKPEKTDVIICPPYLYLELATDFAEESFFSVGAQNISHEGKGAYTGEVSAPMLTSMEVEYCIVGHSERRRYFQEDNVLVGKKVKKALENGIKPIFCCGELLPEREAGNHMAIVEEQVRESLFSLDEEDFKKTIIAYEPVWAIGTGKNATPEQAQEMHAFLRALVAGKYGDAVAGATVILYGGSCNAKNAKELFAQKDVDGGLIGGASLNAKDFITIVHSFPK